MNWEDIASKCNTTAGAASKRYSRMKQAFEQDVAAPGASPRSPVKTVQTKGKGTSKKAQATTASDDDIEATPTPKRKRASPKKKAVAGDEEKYKPQSDDDDDDHEDGKKSKRARTAKAKAAPKPKAGTKAKNTAKSDINLPTPTTEATTLIKGEPVDGNDAFYDAQEYVGAQDEVQDEDTADRKFSLFPLTPVLAQDSTTHSLMEQRAGRLSHCCVQRGAL